MKKLLLVEDDQFLRNIYVQMLTPVYELDVAENGQIAYDKISQNTYDLILLDMFLPKLDGKLVFEQLQKNFPDVYKNKIVFMTNDDSKDIIDYFNKVGVKYFIKSELNPGQFIEKIENYLNK